MEKYEEETRTNVIDVDNGEMGGGNLATPMRNTIISLFSSDNVTKCSICLLF
jgi:hypothetical protein